MAYRIAGVHKRKLGVVVADVEVDDEYQAEPHRSRATAPTHNRPRVAAPLKVSFISCISTSFAPSTNIGLWIFPTRLRAMKE